MSMQIVPTARKSPGKCVISNDNRGPFIDTGKKVRNYGRVYISIHSLRNVLGDLGYVPVESVQETLKQNEDLKEKNSTLSDIKESYEELVDLLTPYLPQPKAEEVVITKTVTRNPTDEEIAEWILTNGADHPVVKQATSIEKGSTEEWNKIYRDDTGKLLRAQQEINEVEETEVEEQPSPPTEGPDEVIILKDQEVNLKDLLNENVDTIVKFCEGQPDEFLEAVAEYEWFLAESSDTEPRKGVLKALGYWDAEEDVPLMPVYDEGEEE